MRWARNVQRRRSSAFITYRTFVLREVREFSTSGELNSLLPHVVGSKTERRTCGGRNHSAECIQWMHYGAHCCPGHMSEFAVRKEGKEKNEEFLFWTVSRPGLRLLTRECMYVDIP